MIIRRNSGADLSDMTTSTSTWRSREIAPYMNAIAIIALPNTINCLRTKGTHGLYAMKSLKLCANSVSPRKGTQTVNNVIKVAKIFKRHFIGITFRQIVQRYKYSF